MQHSSFSLFVQRMAGAPLFAAAVLTILANAGFVEGFLNKDVGCKPRKVLVPIDPPRYQYYPRFVEVFRCDGACSTLSPKVQKCHAVTWSNISGNIFDLSTNSLKAVTFQNHTSCQCDCVLKAEDCSENEEFVKGFCACQCKYTDNPTSPCPERFRWSPFECKCVCRGPVAFCSAGQEWSHEACDCVCTQIAVERCKAEKKYLNTTTCKCKEQAQMSTTNPGPGDTGRRSAEEIDWKRLLGIMAAELIVLVFLFDLYLYWRYQKGVMRWIVHSKCFNSSKATTNENSSMENALYNPVPKPSRSNGSPTMTRHV